MATRIGKYKISKRESEVSLRDGGQVDGTLIAEGGSATGAAAGGSAAGTLAGGDNAGTITVSTQLANTNTFTVTWGTARAAAPNCVVTSNVGVVNWGYTVSTTALTITATGNTSTGDIHYVCL